MFYAGKLASFHVRSSSKSKTARQAVYVIPLIFGIAIGSITDDPTFLATAEYGEDDNIHLFSRESSQQLSTQLQHTSGMR
ncbi:MAG: hypothetical protein M2R45_01651 [Verrucomicrobia subdivision 3 bacterium]|nr:hypothetical protein [Limisphaerales bacterium]MCS1412802.1 hypothetical protein [Limisphaerales bacterium]